MGRHAAVAVFALAVVGCSDESSSTSGPETTPPPPDGGTVGCVAGERTLEDGSCQPAGVRPESCADGFQPDDDSGCTPVLPASQCGEGRMAVPGETTCREVAPCGDAPWGDIPVDGDTQYVDAAYRGTDSDGSESRPWTTINEAVAAAVDGAIVAIAAGSYAEDVRLWTKPVRLWGRCPDLVEIVGAPDGIGSVDIRTGGDEAEVHTLAVTGPTTGIAISGAQDVLIDRVWSHHNGHAAIAAEATLGATSLHIEGSLLEHALEYGIFANSADLTISRSVIRDTKAGPLAPGRGLNLQTNLFTHVATATITSSIFERNTEHGIFVYASQLTMEGSLVQDTLPNDLDQAGRALDIEDDEETGARSVVIVRSSVLQRNMDISATCTGSDLWMESTTIRDTRPMASDMTFGRGFSAADRVGRANVIMLESVITRCHDAGAIFDGSDATFESVLIRDVGSQASDLTDGRGLGAQPGLTTEQRSNLAVRWSVIDRVREVGIVAIGSDLRVEGTLVRQIAPTEDIGELGDGITLVKSDQPTNGWVVGSRVESAARAGVSSFGAAIELSTTILECNPIQLNAEPLGPFEPTFVNAGGVSCGCGDETQACTVSASMLKPPGPLEK